MEKKGNIKFANTIGFQKFVKPFILIMNLFKNINLSIPQTQMTINMKITPTLTISIILAKFKKYRYLNFERTFRSGILLTYH